jgi:hypothetical protein
MVTKELYIKTPSKTVAEDKFVEYSVVSELPNPSEYFSAIDEDTPEYVSVLDYPLYVANGYGNPHYHADTQMPGLIDTDVLNDGKSLEQRSEASTIMHKNPRSFHTIIPSVEDRVINAGESYKRENRSKDPRERLPTAFRELAYALEALGVLSPSATTMRPVVANRYGECRLEDLMRNMPSNEQALQIEQETKSRDGSIASMPDFVVNSEQLYQN